ncbi:MAG: ABC transporter ATP-binding protein [Spirochaetota bacterium]
MLDITEYSVEVRRIAKVFAVETPGMTGAVRERTYVTALDGVDLRINPGELFVILGPSGCGKSTLLRCIAGLEEPEQGEIALGGRRVYSAGTGESVAARDREIGMVFQNFALYPHMTVAQNVGFGLRTRKVPQAEAAERITEALRLVEMEEYADRSPARLSGGQQQRVALARAIAGNPKTLLFDEPLSNLDPLLRKTVRAELKQLITRLRITSLFVTHDQEEAMILGDRVAVMHRGKVEQIGSPGEVYRRPQTLFVAGFTGRPVTNLIEGVVEEHQGESILVPIESRAETLRLPRELLEFRRQRVTLHVRPEDVEVVDESRADATELSVENVLPEGGHTFVRFRLGGPYQPLVARTGPAVVGKAATGGRRRIVLSRGTVYSPDTGYLIGSFGE